MRKTSIFSWFGFPFDMNERFKLIKEVGFDGVLLWWSDENMDTDGPKEKQPELAMKNGLFVENAHLPFEGINSLWLDNLDGEDYEKLITSSIKQCGTFEVPTVVLHVSKGFTPPPITDIGLNRFKRIVDTAEKSNVNVAFENLIRPDYLDYIFNNISSPKVGFCYDSGHNNCYTPQRDFLGQYGSRLMALHLHDNDGSDDQHMLPFDGTIDWDKIKSQLKASGYAGPITLEIERNRNAKYADMSAEEFLQRGFNCAQRLME